MQISMTGGPLPPRPLSEAQPEARCTEAMKPFRCLSDTHTHTRNYDSLMCELKTKLSYVCIAECWILSQQPGRMFSHHADDKHCSCLTSEAGGHFGVVFDCNHLSFHARASDKCQAQNAHNHPNPYDACSYLSLGLDGSARLQTQEAASLQRITIEIQICPIFWSPDQTPPHVWQGFRNLHGSSMGRGKVMAQSRSEAG